MRALVPCAVIAGALAAWCSTVAAAPVSASASAPSAPSAPSASPRAAPSEPALEPAPDGVDYVVVPPSPPDRYRSTGLTRLIYLNACRGGCAIGNQRNDAFTNQSTIAKMPGTLNEFPFGDAAWTDLVRCVRHAYDLYDVTITTDEPPTGTDHVEVMVAGSPRAIGFSSTTLGISPLASDCSPLRNVLSFAFAEAHSAEALYELCATVVHEAGHTFGLDHALQCRDPMTYLTGCGDKLFLNIESQCGEFRKSRFCRCSDKQNSHVKLLNELGSSGLSATPGQIQMLSPSIWDGSLISGLVKEKRWIRSIELWINGFRWAKLPHQSVQDFNFPAPVELSDGILDVEVREVNDLGVVGVDRRTLTKGAPCTSAASCRAPETCNQGKCVYPPPTGQLGQTCAAAQDCASWECLDYAGAQRCSVGCLVGTKNSDCPGDYTCVSSDENGTGMCWPTQELPAAAGCCGATGETPSALPNALVLLAALGGLTLRRRTRAR
jgi:MYXO-CTERM domain-containing protein